MLPLQWRKDMQFCFTHIEKCQQTGLEIGKISKIDVNKILRQCDHDKYYLGRMNGTSDKWFLVGEKDGKRKNLKKMSKYEVRKVVGV